MAIVRSVGSLPENNKLCIGVSVSWIIKWALLSLIHEKYGRKKKDGETNVREEEKNIPNQSNFD